MNKFYPKQSKATLCSKYNCITVYGKTAKTVNVITLSAVTVIVIAFIFKALQ